MDKWVGLKYIYIYIICTLTFSFFQGAAGEFQGLAGWLVGQAVWKSSHR